MGDIILPFRGIIQNTLLIGALLLPCNSLARLHWQQLDYLLQAFLEVTLKNEFHAQQTNLKKWQQPIKIKMVYEYPDAQRYQHLVIKHLLHLRSITNHPIYTAEEEANLKIILTTDNLWQSSYLPQFDEATQQKMQTTVCMGRMQLDRQNQIVGGVVVIPIDRAIRHRKLVTCIVEELTQVMGLPNDSERVYPSIFNDKTPNDLLTGLDYLLLKLLYHPDLKPDMNAAQITKTARPILLDWQSQGIITSAQQEVRKGDLYPMLGY